MNDSALDIGGYYGTTISVRSSDWALEDIETYAGDPGPRAYQDFSLRDARDYFYRALTDRSLLVRSANFGSMFQALGHVIHHLQDMAQPQHVRNDVHCDEDACRSLTSALGINQLFAPSMYEKYTDLGNATNPYESVRLNLPYLGTGSTPAFPAASNGASPFRTARSLWRTTAVGGDIASGKGIAEYTNRNFFSAGTIQTYPSPPPPGLSFTTYHSPSSEVDVSALLGGAAFTGKVRFWNSEVTDSLTGVTETNERALSEGLLDSDLVKRYSTTQPGYLVYALNRFTFDAAHKFLIPRAVGYSAGLINFFFRGQLEISPPDEGVYGIVDHTVENRPDVDGFARIKLKVRNVTPGGANVQGQAIVEPIPDNSGGTLVAVAKFHRNACYTANLSGEYGSPGINWSACRAPTEEIVVSMPQPVPAGMNDASQTVAFTFPTKVPINATDVYLQVVYRGPLGEEPDHVMVATVDIGEPLYLTQHSMLDQFLYFLYPSLEPGTYTFEQWCAQGRYPSYDECRSSQGATLKVRFGASPGYTDQPIYAEGEWHPLAAEPPFAAVATMPAPVGTYARVAMLTDPSPRNGTFLWERINPTNTSLFQWNGVSLMGIRNQLDFATNALSPFPTLAPGRGIYVYSADSPLLNAGTAPNIAPLAPSRSQITF